MLACQLSIYHRFTRFADGPRSIFSCEMLSILLATCFLLLHKEPQSLKFAISGSLAIVASNASKMSC